MGKLNVISAESVMQLVTLRIQRTLSGEQAGLFYGSAVRISSASDEIRQYKDEDVMSVPANFEPLRDEDGNNIPQMVSIRVGNQYVERDVTGLTCSLALTESNWTDLQELPGQSWLITLKAKVNVNARKGHGREGTFWVENLDAEMHLVEAEGPVAAATEQDLDASLEKGRAFAEQGQRQAMQRRDERTALRPTRLLSREERAAQTLGKIKGKPGMDPAAMRKKAEQNAGLSADKIPQAPSRPTTQPHAAAPEETTGNED